MTDQLPGVMITNEQIFAELRGVSDKVNQAIGKLDDVSLHTSDHEVRIRALERVDARLSEAEKDITELKTARKDNRAIWIAGVVAVSAWVPDVIALIAK